MIDLYSPDLIATVHVNKALSFVPPNGYYIVGIERVVGNVPPLSGPLKVVPYGDRTEEGIQPFKIDEAKVFLSHGRYGLSVFLVDPFDVIVELRLRANSKVKVGLLSELRAPSLTKSSTVLSYWSVAAGTTKPTYMERYTPALGKLETMATLFNQDDELALEGHELMVRYIP